MATSFEDIYCLNSVIKNDSRLLNKPAYELYSLYWKYLQFAISYFIYDCHKNLNDNIPFSFTEYSFTGDGVNNIFVLTPAPSDPLTINFYIAEQIACGEKYQTINNYTWDSENNTITFNNVPVIGSNIKIYAYQIGQFNEDLDINEKRILAEGMNIPYFEESYTSRKVLDFSTYGGSIKMHSQAEHEKTLIDAVKAQYKIVDSSIAKYSFRMAPIGYPGMGARTVCYDQTKYNKYPYVQNP